MNRIILLFLLFVSSGLLAKEGNWPKEIKTEGGGLITVYQPQPESMSGDKINGRAAFSAKLMPGDELTFGVFWYVATIATDRDQRTIDLDGISITNMKLPGVDDSVKINKLKALLEKEIPKWKFTGTLDEISATIEQENASENLDFKNEAPTIYYKTQPTTLVLMDGEPQLKQDDNLKMKRVINTPSLIVENPGDKKFYFYGEQSWYVSTSVVTGYKPISTLPKELVELDKQLKKDQKNKATSKTPPPALLISTKPAELIQSAGEAQFSSIEGTNLLFIANSDDDIFKFITDQKYYLLLSGRWYASPKLEGPWAYVAADQLPTDFAKIPEGSTKDKVLSSVPGTPACKEAVMDAQIPQTAKVDRKTATCTVTYDGEPAFEKIEGTSLEVAMNTSSSVIRSGSKYYCVETGVWFVANSAKGPWAVSDERPKEVDKIPPSSKVHNTQYVYIYDSTPQVVYVGYTPGYMGCYVYGGTVIYGTGYYYNPWYGPYYYPQPVTYGFSMHYNPWTGWSMGVHASYGMLHVSVYSRGGYWGPPMYRPPYYPPYHGGMYGGRGPTYIHNGDININGDRSNNIYNRRNDVSTRDQVRGSQNGSPKPSQQPVKPGNGSKNDVFSDKNGNVYQRKDNGDWNQRKGNSWEQTKQPSNMDKDYQNRQRSNTTNSNYQQMNRGGNLGGGNRGGGGGGGRRR